MKHALLILMLVMCGLTAAHAQFADTPKREYRAVWLTTIKGLDWPTHTATTAYGEEQQKAELRHILDTLQAVGINTVLLQTRLRGDVIYPSLMEPFASVFTGHEGRRPSYDPLAFAIDECHRRGMQCHAWMVALQVKDNKYVDPSSAAVVDHLCSMVREVVRGYDVDGIHLDYIRYPEKTHGNESWRRDNITRVMRAVYATVKAEKPWVIVSAAPLGKYRDTRRYSSHGWNAWGTVFQEAQEWTREGIVDALFPMLYYKDQHFYPFVDDWSANAHGRHFAAGLGIYQLDRQEQNWPLSVIRQQICYTRSFDTHTADGMTCGTGANGYALFRAGFICNNTKGLKDELRHLNATPALVPALTWQRGENPDAPQGVSVTLMADHIRISWAATDPHLHYNLYRSVGTPVRLDDARHLCRTYLEGSSITLPRLRTSTPIAAQGEASDTYYALTAIDRYGRESRPVIWTDKTIRPKPIDTRLRAVFHYDED